VGFDLSDPTITIETPSTLLAFPEDFSPSPYSPVKKERLCGYYELLSENRKRGDLRETAPFDGDKKHP